MTQIMEERLRIHEMKKHILFKTIAVFVLILHIFIISGCENETELPDDAPALVIIAGMHSNSQKMNVDFSNKIETVYTDFGSIGVIISDGKPTVEYTKDGNMLGVYSASYMKESVRAKKNNELFWRNNYLNIQISALENKIDNLIPNDSEVDTLNALIEAEDVFNVISNKNAKTKEIVIYDTGLCTSGELNFLNENVLKLLFSNEIDKICVENLVNELDAKNLIPNLTNIKVTWYGLGAVAGAQPELSELNNVNLQIIWGEILKRANALPNDNKNSDSEYGYFISVPTAPEAHYDEFVTPVINWYNEEEITLTEEKIGFKLNSAELISEENTINILTPYAQNLKNYPRMRIVLAGTTADPDKNGGSITLSQERANTVKALLCKLGVNEDNITVIGWGAKAPLYDTAEWQNGCFIEEVAKRNRAVWILPYESNTAQEILNIQNKET